MKNHLAKIGVSLLLVFLVACSTVTPDHVKDKTPEADSSTPTQYSQFNNGFIGFRKDASGRDVEVITKAKAAEVTELAKKYKITFKERFGKSIDPGEGMAPWKDQHGNEFVAVQFDAAKKYKLLRQLARDQEKGDSIIDKAKDIL